MHNEFPEKIHVRSASAIFPDARNEREFEPGVTIAEIVSGMGIPERFKNLIVVFVDGVEVKPSEYWTKPDPGHAVNIAIRPANDETGRWLIQNAFLVGGALVERAIGGTWGWAAGFGISMLGTVASNTLLPPQDVPLLEQSRAISLTENTVQLNKIIPKIYGRVRVYPALIAQPIIEWRGDAQYTTLLYCIGHAPLRISELKFGDQLIGWNDTPTKEGGGRSIRNSADRYNGLRVVRRGAGTSTSRKVNDITIQTDTGWTYGRYRSNRSIDRIRFMRDAQQEICEFLLEHALFFEDLTLQNLDSSYSAWTSLDYWDPRAVDQRVFHRTTPDNTEEISVDIVFPDGLYKKDGDDYKATRVDLHIQYRPYGSTGYASWRNVRPSWAVDQNQDINTFTDSQIWTFLTELNAKLGGMIASMQQIAASARVVSDQLADYVLRQLGETQLSIQDLQESGTLSTGNAAILTDVQTNIIALADIMATVSRGAATISEQASVFNNILSLAIALGEFIDNFVRVAICVDRGVGPPLYTLPWFQQLLVNWQGVENLFATVDPGAFIVTSDEKAQATLRKNVSWTVPAGKYEVRIRRATLDAKSTGSEKDPDVCDDVQVYAFTTYQHSSVVSQAAQDKYAFVQLKVRITDQLATLLDKFNLIAEAPLGVYDTKFAALTDPNIEATRNPAWAMVDIVCGAAAKNPIDVRRCDANRIQEFANYCTEKGFTFDGIFDSDATVQSALNAVLRVARATPILRDGKLSIVYDHEQTVPSMVITNRNSRGLVGRKSYDRAIHAIRIKFVNEEKGHQVDERVVYDDGYGDPGFGLLVPEKIEEAEFVGLRNSQQAYVVGRYLIACARLRPESFEVTMDFENLVSERGDLVYMQNDVTLWGLGAARVTSVTYTTARKVASITIDSDAYFLDETSYQARVRTSKNKSYVASIVPVAGDFSQFVFAPHLDIDSDNEVAIGDLVAWGEMSKVTIPCLIKEITPQDDMCARLTLMEYAEAVFDAENGIIPSFDSKITMPVAPNVAVPAAPIIEQIITDEFAATRNPDDTVDCRIGLVVRVAKGTTPSEQMAASQIAGIEVQYREAPRETVTTTSTGARWRDAGRSKDVEWHVVQVYPAASSMVYAEPVKQGAFYDVRVRVTTKAGMPSDWRTVFDVKVIGVSAPPPDIHILRLEAGTLKWAYKPPVDFRGYLVRVCYGGSPSWANAVAMHPDVIITNSFVIPPGEYLDATFMVKAQDLSRNESVNAAMISYSGDITSTTTWEAFKLMQGSRQGSLADRVYNHYSAASDGGAARWPSLSTDCENMEISGSEMRAVALSKTEFYVGAEAPFYRVGSDPFYQTVYPTCYARFGFTRYPNGTDVYGNKVFVSDFLDLGTRFDFRYSKPPSGLSAAEIAVGAMVNVKDNYTLLWPEEPAGGYVNENLWPTTMTEDFWPYYATYAEPMGAFEIAKDGSISYEYQVKVWAGNERFRLHSGQALVRAPYVVEEFTGVSVTAAGLNIAISQNTFQRIDRVFAQLSTPDDTKIVVVQTMEPYDDPMGANVRTKAAPYLTTGPFVKVLDMAGTPTSGTVDVIVEGY